MSIEPGGGWVTCNYCKMSSFVQSQPEVAPAPAYPPSPSPAYAPPTPRKGSGAVVVALIGLSVLGVAAAGLVSTLGRTTQSVAVSLPAAVRPPSVSPAVLAPERPKPKAPTEPDLFADATPFTTALTQKFGANVVVQELVVYEHYVGVRVQDPQKPTHIDSYFFMRGEFQAPSPVSQSVSDQELPQTLFAVKDFDFALLPKLIAATRQEIQVEDGKVSHVIFDRDRNRPPIIRVYLSSVRGKGGRAEFSFSGKKLRVYK